MRKIKIAPPSLYFEKIKIQYKFVNNNLETSLNEIKMIQVTSENVTINDFTFEKGKEYVLKNFDTEIETTTLDKIKSKELNKYLIPYMIDDTKKRMIMEKGKDLYYHIKDIIKGVILKKKKTSDIKYILKKFLDLIQLFLDEEINFYTDFKIENFLVYKDKIVYSDLDSWDKNEVTYDFIKNENFDIMYENSVVIIILFQYLQIVSELFPACFENKTIFYFDIDFSLENILNKYNYNMDSFNGILLKLRRRYKHYIRILNQFLENNKKDIIYLHLFKRVLSNLADYEFTISNMKSILNNKLDILNSSEPTPKLIDLNSIFWYSSKKF